MVSADPEEEPPPKPSRVETLVGALLMAIFDLNIMAVVLLTVAVVVILKILGF